MLKLGYRDAFGAAEFAAVKEEHVRTLRAHKADAGEVFGYEFAGIADIFVNDGDHLLRPLLALTAERAGQRTHGENVEVVVVGHGALPDYAVAQIFIIYYMVGADESRKGEGLAGRIERYDAVFRILGDGLRGNVPVTGHDDVRPYLVGYDDAIVRGVDLHCTLYLPALPHSAAGIVRRAEDGEVNVVFLELAVHILVIHAPDTVFIALELAVDYDAARVVHRVRKADIGGGVDEYLVAGSGESLHRAAHAAQHTVFITDMLRPEPLDAVSAALPVNNAVKILLRQLKIAEVRHFHALIYRIHDRRRAGEAHVRYPHRDNVKALVRTHSGKRDLVKSLGIAAMAVKNGRKIVFHFFLLVCVSTFCA